MYFSEVVIRWYESNKRALPWREIRDPYLIWLSEIILQQTRVEQGLPYYYRFAEAFPDVIRLAAAPEDKVMKLWQGLGYYSRARNMHATAKKVAGEFGGRFPVSYSVLIGLKGIGEYTASAISSFAGNEPRAVVDGNVYRLLARYFGIDLPIDRPEGKRYFSRLAGELLDKTRPGLHNQAVMEFGALQCKPAAPLCPVCPLRADCRACREDTVKQLPVKSQRTKSRERYFNYLVIRDKDRVWLNRREAGDIWQSLYEFPLVETEGPLEERELLILKRFRDILNGNEFAVRSVSGLFRHVLSHQVIHARFWQLEAERNAPLPGPYFAVREGEMAEYAFPKLIVNYLASCQL